MKNKSNEEYILNSEYFKLIEDAIGQNNSSSIGWFKRKLKLVLNAFLEGKTVIIEDLGIKLSTLSKCKEWKKERDKLNMFNSELLIKEIELSNSRKQTW